MLLYLIKHSRPDIANAVRELSKVADGATMANFKALLRCIKYVIDTKTKALKMNPTLNKDGFYLEGISDSEYAGDANTRISVYGYFLYFCGAPIAWKSKSGKSVTLSSTEAEYYATSEVAKEVLFAKQILEAIGISITYPIIIKCDNVGAIYLSNNHSMSQRTKHIDTRRHFVREYVEDEILKIVFVPTKENEADILTKNTAEADFATHTPKMIEDIKLSDALMVMINNDEDIGQLGYEYCSEGGDFIKHPIKKEKNKQFKRKNKSRNNKQNYHGTKEIKAHQNDIPKYLNINIINNINSNNKANKSNNENENDNDSVISQK
jgi:hypothetical protein